MAAPGAGASDTVNLLYLHDLGLERVTSNHMVNNRAILIAKLKSESFVTGMALDERWGVLGSAG